MPLTKQGAFDAGAQTELMGTVPELAVGTPNFGPTAIAANGAIAPSQPGLYNITKAGVAALTLAAPVAGADDGKVIMVYSDTANAHTLTATGLLRTGAAAVNLATYAAQIGAFVKLMALNGKWQVLAQLGITFS